METRLYTFMDLFSGEVETKNGAVQIEKIIIPIIQRDYAQGRRGFEVDRVRSRFLDSLYKALTETPITLDFVYGNVENGILTPLDGQQRLTTLFLLHWYAGVKENIPADEMVFLKRFSYETRYSARDFCESLVDYRPSFERTISRDIVNQAWFPLEWQKDQTIASMLVMLDDIDEKFRQVDGIWELLQSKRITFYILPLEDMELTDELYIKMNSRGKPLTQFEHFKAELEKTLTEIDPVLAMRIIRKIDIDWSDMLWEYRGDNNITDDEFLHYFKYICDVICYKEGGTPQGRSYDEFDLLKTYFSKDDEHVRDHVELLEQYFDCWCNLPNDESPSDFISRFISHDHEPGKIKIDSRYAIDIFSRCLNNYADLNGRNRMFPLNRIMTLYAITDYLLHRETVTEEQFARRLRIVNNLISNSEFEISDSTTRTSGNRIPAIMKQIDRIVCEGVIDLSIDRAFNVNQLNEEQVKLEWLDQHPDKSETVFELEDHYLLTGQIGIIGLDHIDMSTGFSELFNCDWDKVDCALMSIGFYGQREQNNWRFQLGTKSQRNYSAWREMFHRSGSQGFENTSAILLQLLQKCEHPSDEKLQEIADQYLSECEEKKTYGWRYYYIKYPAFRPGSYGKYSNDSTESKPYMFSVMMTRSQWSEYTYMPFLKEADPDHTMKEYMGQRLVYNDCYIKCENAAYMVFDKETEKENGSIPILQNKDGIDTEDRVVLLKNYIQTHNLIQQQQVSLFDQEKSSSIQGDMP